MTYLSDEDFEAAAKSLRVKIGVDDELRPKMIDVLRTLKHSGIINDYVRVPNEAMPDVEAKFDPDNRKIFLRESTYIAAERENDRARWTIAHEVGHAVFAHSKTRNRSSNPGRIEKIAPSIRCDETQANKFAAAFLAPFHRADFSLETTPEQIARRFGVSVPAAVARVEELTRIYRRINGLRRPLPSSVIDLLGEAQRRGHKIRNAALAELIAERNNSTHYEGDACPCCNNFKMVRNGLHMKCENCGTKTGDD